MGIYRRSRHRVGDKRYSRACKTKHYKRDLDQIHEDLSHREQVIQKIREVAINEINEEGQPTYPGFGQFYCIECA